jgi:hypothetical protein
MYCPDSPQRGSRSALHGFTMGGHTGKTLPEVPNGSPVGNIYGQNSHTGRQMEKETPDVSVGEDIA